MADEKVNAVTEPEEEELEVEVVEPEYPGGQEIDEQRRAYVIAQMACADIDGKVLVSNMEQVYRWLKGDQEASCSTTRPQPAPLSCVSLVPTLPSSKA